MLQFYVVLTVFYLAALCMLLWVSRKNKNVYALAKGICSSLFLFCALGCFAFGSRQDLLAFVLLAAGLFLCAFGDVLLGMANRNAQSLKKTPFITGALSFLLAHLVFCILFYRWSHFRLYDLFFSVILIGVLWLLENKGKIKLKKIRPIAYLYTIAVALMATKAVELSLNTTINTFFGSLVGVGATLFLLSDGILLFLYFGTVRRRWLRMANLISYYFGVYLIATSAFWL